MASRLTVDATPPLAYSQVMTQTQRIGFCCKWLDHAGQVNGFKPKDPAKQYNTGSTTVKWLNENKSKATQKIYELAISNIDSAYRLVEKVSGLQPHLRMVRLGSDILPVFTEPTYRSFYNDSSVQKDLATRFARVGQLARDNDVRLSFHPGQFCVLASDKADVVLRSVDEFEYHVNMARWMGYGSSWHDHGFKINVHIAGAQGAEGIIRVLPHLSQEAQNLITIENEEMKWGLDETLKLADHVAIVLDIHHHWVKTGEYIQANDDRVKRVVDSWRGVRPSMHYSMPRADAARVIGSCGKPDYAATLAAGGKRAELRAHSDFYWCQAANDWARTFADQFDIQCEAKAKNLAASALASSWGL